MEFKIERTSFRWSENQPCEEAYKKDDKWMVCFNSLNELINFTTQWKNLVLIAPSDYEECYTIEIYDDWRE